METSLVSGPFLQWMLGLVEDNQAVKGDVKKQPGHACRTALPGSAWGWSTEHQEDQGAPFGSLPLTCESFKSAAVFEGVRPKLACCIGRQNDSPPPPPSSQTCADIVCIRYYVWFAEIHLSLDPNGRKLSVGHAGYNILWNQWCLEESCKQIMWWKNKYISTFLIKLVH